MATVYSSSRWNGEGTTGWRIRVDYSGTSATVYADVVSTYNSSSIWLRFTNGTNTCSRSAYTYYSSDNGKSNNKLGTITIDPYSSKTVIETCSGSSWGGNVNGESSVTIPVQYAPTDVSINPVASRTSINLNRSWNHATTCQYNINDWGWVAEGTTYSNGVKVSGNDVTGLTPNTTYTCQVRFYNSGVGPTTSAKKTVTTTGNAPTISSVTPSPARTTCSLANNSVSYDTNASFSSVSIKYGTTESYGSTASSTSLSGLAANTKYYFSMTITDNFGRTSNAKTGSFTTTGNAPTVSSVSTTPSRTGCSFTLNVSYDTNASFSSRRIEYGTSTNYGSSTTDTSISGLTPNTTYYYRARVTDNYSRTSDWKTGSFTTTGNAPTVNSISATPSRTGCTISHNTSYDTNASYNSIEIQYGTSTSYGSTSTSTSLTSLTPNTKYYYRVRVKDNWNRTSSWKSSNFTTTGNIPTISNGSVTNIKSKSATISVTDSYDTNASISLMEIKIYLNNTLQQTLTSLTHSMSTGDILKPGKNYVAKVTVTDNWSRKSSEYTLTFKTKGGFKFNGKMSDSARLNGKEVIGMKFNGIEII